MVSHDFDFDTLKNNTNVKGSVHKNIEQWHHKGANPSVTDTIVNGYKIPFFTTLVSNFFQYN